MRILFLSGEFPRPTDPNLAVFNLEMCRALAATHEVRVVSPVAWTERIGRRQAFTDTVLSSLPVSYRQYYFPPRILHAERGRLMWWATRRYLLAMCGTWRPDVILTYWIHPDGEVAARLGRKLHVPVVQVVGGSDVLVLRNDPRRRERVRRVLMSVDAVVTMGRNLGAQVVALGVPPARVHSLYRPVDTARFHPGDRDAARRRLGLDSSARLVIWVGRLVKIKAIDVLISAFAQVLARVPRARLLLLGDGPSKSALLSQATAQGLSGAVDFVGPVAHDALPDWYRAADTTVLPSLSEGVPNVLLESMACGVPFVASRVGGISEIADRELDILVPPGDVDALAAALVRQLEREPVAERTVKPVSPQEFVHQLECIMASSIAIGAQAVGVL